MNAIFSEKIIPSYRNTKNKTNDFNSYIKKKNILNIHNDYSDRLFPLRIVFRIQKYIIEFKYNTPFIFTYSIPNNKQQNGTHLLPFFSLLLLDF